MTSPRLPVVTAPASLRRRGRGAGKPAAHPVSPPSDESDPATPLLIDSREVARLLGLGRTKVFQMMLRGEVPTVRIGRSVRVPREGLVAWVAKQTKSASIANV